jgi:hypothetical protein
MTSVCLQEPAIPCCLPWDHQHQGSPHVCDDSSRCVPCTQQPTLSCRVLTFQAAASVSIKCICCSWRTACIEQNELQRLRPSKPSTPRKDMPSCPAQVHTMPRDSQLLCYRLYVLYVLVFLLLLLQLLARRAVRCCQCQTRVDWRSWQRCDTVAAAAAAAVAVLTAACVNWQAVTERLLQLKHTRDELACWYTRQSCIVLGWHLLPSNTPAPPIITLPAAAAAIAHL